MHPAHTAACAHGVACPRPLGQVQAEPDVSEDHVRVTRVHVACCIHGACPGALAGLVGQMCRRF
jgi:hypothetical protein